MILSNTSPPPANPVEEAINLALHAELTARDAIRLAQIEAAEILLDARRQAAEIENRTNRRITTIHKRRAKLLKKQVQEMLRQAPTEEPDSDSLANSQRLEHAVDGMAAMLTSDEESTQLTGKPQ